METRREASVVHLPKPAGRDDSRVTREDARLMVAPVAGGSVIGTLVGIIPGLGPTLGAFLGYDAAWRLAKRPELFGKGRSEEHTSELQSLMRISYAVFCWKKKNKNK